MTSILQKPGQGGQTNSLILSTARGALQLVFIPRGTVYAFRVRSETARLLNLYTQPGFERVLEMAGQPTAQRTVPPPD